MVIKCEKKNILETMAEAFTTTGTYNTLDVSSLTNYNTFQHHHKRNV